MEGGDYRCGASVCRVSAGRVDGRADERGLRVARARARVHVGGVRAARARRHVRHDRRAHLRRARRTPPRLLAPAPTRHRLRPRPPVAAPAPRAATPRRGGHKSTARTKHKLKVFTPLLTIFIIFISSKCI